MKVNKISNKVAIFSIAAIALTGAGIYHHNMILNKSQDSGVSVFAATGRAVNNITIIDGDMNLPENRWGTYTVKDFKVTFSVDEQVSAGDYVEIEFDNINYSRDIFNNREIRINDEIIGRFEYVSHQENDGILSYKYRFVFNENITKYDNRNITIDGANIIGFTSKTGTLTQTIKVAGKIAANKVGGEIKAVQEDRILPNTDIGLMWLSSVDGETIQERGMTSVIRHSRIDADKKLEVGDIVEYILPSDKGIAFGFKEGEEYYYNNGGGSGFKVRVMDASPHHTKLEIIHVDNDVYAGIARVPVTLLDTSPKTIDYENNKLIEFRAPARILRGSEEVYSDMRTYRGDIQGSKLKAYADIKKRGSIIRKIQDEKGNKIPGFESDKLILERVQEDTIYDVSAPKIPGYTFVRLAPNSAPQKGIVREGVQNVILVYIISAQDQTIKVGDKPDPKNHIPDFDKNFPGCEVKYKETPDTSKPGVIDATLIISCPDQPDREVGVQIIVEEDKKRGSVIRQIIDEEGNKIPGFESDKLILERVQEGTPYNVEAPQIEGFVLKRLDTNSAPQNGVVKEGVQNVILVYGKPELPKEEPKIEKTPEIKAPDTGSESQGVFAAILSGFSIMAILTAIFFKKK